MKKDHPGKRIAMGASASLICYLGLTALLALLLTRGTMGESAAPPCILAFAVVAAFTLQMNNPWTTDNDVIVAVLVETVL